MNWIKIPCTGAEIVYRQIGKKFQVRMTIKLEQGTNTLIPLFNLHHHFCSTVLTSMNEMFREDGVLIREFVLESK